MNVFLSRNSPYIIIIICILSVYAGIHLLNAPTSKEDTIVIKEKQQEIVKKDSNLGTVVLAGGCFWCVEHDLEESLGVVSVVSGYMGGNGENPIYENYAERGFREVVEVTYNKDQTSFERLAFEMIYHSDPTDGAGSFYDRGQQYSPAIYYGNQEEKNIALDLISRIDKANIYDKPLAVAVLPRTFFYKAEEYHQDYSKKNSLKYSYYRNASGRDAFIKKYQSKLELFRVQLGMAG